MKLEILVLAAEAILVFLLLVSWIYIPNSLINFFTMVAFFAAVAMLEKIKREGNKKDK